MSKYLFKTAGYALVLGGSGGIGSEIAKALSANGVKKLTITYSGNRTKAEEEYQMNSKLLELRCISLRYQSVLMKQKQSFVRCSKMP